MRKTRGCILALLMFFSFYEDCCAMSMFGFSRPPPAGTGSTTSPRSSRAKRTKTPRPPKVQPTLPDEKIDQSSPESEGGISVDNSGGEIPSVQGGEESSSANGGSDSNIIEKPPAEPVVATDTDSAKIQAMNSFQKTRLDMMRCLCEEAMFYAKRGEANIKTAPPGVTLEQEKKYARDNYSNAMGLISTMLGDTEELTAAMEHMKKQKEDADLFKPDFCSIPKKDSATPPGADWNYKIHGEWKDKDEKSMSRSLGWKSKISLYARCISLSISGRNCAKHPKEKCMAQSKGVITSMKDGASSLKDKIMGTSNKPKSKKKKKKKKKSPLGGIAGTAGGLASMTPAGMAVNMATGGALSGGATTGGTPAPASRRSMF